MWLVPATTAKKYTTQAAQSTELKALKTYGLAEYSWNDGNGAPVQNTSTVYHTYDLSGIYLAKHRLKVNEYGGATSRHFGLVKKCASRCKSLLPWFLSMTYGSRVKDRSRFSRQFSSFWHALLVRCSTIKRNADNESFSEVQFEIICHKQPS